MKVVRERKCWTDVFIVRVMRRRRLIRRGWENQTGGWFKITDVIGFFLVWSWFARRDTGISVTDALELAGDRSFWRQIATAGCYGWSLRVIMMMMMMKLTWRRVCCSLVELIQGGAGGLSVLRTFRLLRILKLVRFLPALQYQLKIMLRTLDNVPTFLALLILFIFIFRSRRWFFAS